MKEIFFKQDGINYSFERIKKEIISIPIQNLLAKDLKSIIKENCIFDDVDLLEDKVLICHDSKNRPSLITGEVILTEALKDKESKVKSIWISKSKLKKCRVLDE